MLLQMSVSNILAHSSVRPNPGFRIGNRNQGPISVSVSEPKFFFRNRKMSALASLERFGEEDPFFIN